MPSSSHVTRHRSSRQRPVSCHFCRSRKLRCSRRFPCPNCTSRGIACELYASQLAVNPPEDNSRVSSTDILSRLQKLEDIVLKKDERVTRPATNPASGGTPELPQNLQEYNATEDAQWLERECSFQDFSNAILPDRIVIKACPIRQIRTPITILNQNFLGNSWGQDITKCYWIPLYEESKGLVEKYITEFTYILHVIHIPSLRATVDHLYQEIQNQVQPKPSDVALLLSVLAKALHLWTPSDSDTLPFLPAEEMNMDVVSIWSRAASDLAEYSSQTSPCSLEEIQARIITSGLVSSLEGVTSRYVELTSVAITRARALCLHKIDSRDSSNGGDRPPTGLVEAELGRRVWWYLAATDWVISQYPGPHKGTYSINPRHMMVKKPRNINDSDLVHGMPIVERPIDYPTHVSYTIQRIRLAEICREITDYVSIDGYSPDILNYNHLLEVDKKINDFISEIPKFFRLEGGSLHEIAEINPCVAAGIITQRYILNSLVHAQRCRLHLPFFARGSVNSAYVYSRNICLESGQMIIRAEQLLGKEPVPFFSARFRFSGALHCLSIAIVVFLLDICLYKDIGQEEERKAKVANACSILKKAKKDSSIASNLLQSFMRVIRKHKVSIGGIHSASADEIDEDHTPYNSLSTGPNTAAGFGPSSSDEILNPGAGQQNISNPESAYWDDIIQTFDSGVNMEMIDWNALFFDLEKQDFHSG